MIDARNVTVITGGLTADPERPTPKIIKFRVAIDYAGNERDSSNKSGYFDVVVYVGDDSNSKFVESQVDQSKMKKGSKVAVLGRLVQERWEKDGKKNSRVVIVAESVSYAGNANTTAGNGSSSKSEAGESVPVPAEF